jgi:integrase
MTQSGWHKMSMSPSMDRYLSEMHLQRRSSTAEHARQVLQDYHYFLLTNPNQDIRSGVLAYLEHCKKRGNGVTTLQNKLTRLKHFYRSINKELNIRDFRLPKSLPEVYTQQEIDTLFAHAGKYLLMWRTLLMSGLRAEELTHLRFANLLDRGIQVAPQRDWMPKSGSERVVPVPGSLLAELRALPHTHEDERVFAVSRYGLLKRLKWNARRAGLDPAKFWPHKFRGSFATTLLRRGVDVRQVAALLGHSKLDVTLKYLALLENTELQSKIEAVWA